MPARNKFGVPLQQPFNLYGNRKSILLKDLEALILAEKFSIINLTISDCKAFLAFHHSSTQTITGGHAAALDTIAREDLLHILKRWACLYSKAVDGLRAKYPVAPHNALFVNNENWSEAVGINVFGMAMLAQASRYAEYWAEKSVVDPRFLGSYEARMRFLESALHEDLVGLKLMGSIHIFDQFDLGIPTYDIARVLFENPPGSAGVQSILGCFAKNGWNVYSFDFLAVCCWKSLHK